jgi:hypothetical protein
MQKDNWIIPSSQGIITGIRRKPEALSEDNIKNEINPMFIPTVYGEGAVASVNLFLFILI